MKFFVLPLIVVLSFAMVACGPRARRGDTLTQNKQRLEEAEIRLHNLEKSLAHVQNQVTEMDSRTYEVRNGKGRKTGMIAVPVTSKKSVEVLPTPAPVASAAEPAKKAPVGKKIDPQIALAKPGDAKPAKPWEAKPQRQEIPVAGPSGQISASSLRPDELALPPTDMPPADGGGDIGMPPETATPVPAVSAPANPATAQTPEPATPPASQKSASPAASVPPMAASATAPSSPAPRVAKQGEEAAYKEALQLARTGRSSEAIARFQEFQQAYPSGKYAPNADFWIGECLYSQGKYQDALAHYQAVNDAYPKHHKNADALLKAGMTLNRLGDAQGASQKFQQLKQSFPNSEAARRAR